MDQNSNVNLQVVQVDCSIKYGPKTLKHLGSISLKKIRPFQNLNFKIQLEIHFFTLIIDQNVLKKI